MLVEFLRATEPSDEDDAPRAVAPIKINPACVGVVFETVTPGVVIIRLMDGRGFKVQGTYANVTEQLEAVGHTVS